MASQYAVVMRTVVRCNDTRINATVTRQIHKMFRTLSSDMIRSILQYLPTFKMVQLIIACLKERTHDSLILKSFSQGSRHEIGPCTSNGFGCHEHEYFLYLYRDLKIEFSMSCLRIYISRDTENLYKIVKMLEKKNKWDDQSISYRVDELMKRLIFAL